MLSFKVIFFKKESPYVVFQSRQTQHAKKIIFNENFLIAVTVADATNKRYVDDSIFTINAKYHPDANTTISKTLLPCTLKDVEFNKSLCTTLGLEGSFCLQNKSFNLEGYWDEDMINYLVFNIFECDNRTSGCKCKPLEAIDFFFTDPAHPKHLGAIYHDAS